MEDQLQLLQPPPQLRLLQGLAHRPASPMPSRIAAGISKVPRSAADSFQTPEVEAKVERQALGLCKFLKLPIGPSLLLQHGPAKVPWKRPPRPSSLQLPPILQTHPPRSRPSPRPLAMDKSQLPSPDQLQLPPPSPTWERPTSASQAALSPPPVAGGENHQPVRDWQRLGRGQQERDAQLMKIRQRLNRRQHDRDKLLVKMSRRQQESDEQRVKFEQSSPRFTRQPTSPTYCSTAPPRPPGSGPPAPPPYSCLPSRSQFKVFLFPNQVTVKGSIKKGRQDTSSNIHLGAAGPRILRKTSYSSGSPSSAPASPGIRPPRHLQNTQGRCRHL